MINKLWFYSVAYFYPSERSLDFKLVPLIIMIIRNTLIFFFFFEFCFGIQQVVIAY